MSSSSLMRTRQQTDSICPRLGFSSLPIGVYDFHIFRRSPSVFSSATQSTTGRISTGYVTPFTRNSEYRYSTASQPVRHHLTDQTTSVAYGYPDAARGIMTTTATCTRQNLQDDSMPGVTTLSSLARQVSGASNTSQSRGRSVPYDPRFQLSGDQIARATGTTTQSGNEDLYYQGMQILGEQVIEHEVMVPTKRIVEEVIEKMIVVPEKVQREEVVEEKKILRERIVQVAQPVEKIKYVDEIQVVEQDKIVEVPRVIQKENIRYEEKWSTEEVVKRVPKYIELEKEVEYEVIQYQTVPVPRTVEVPELRVIEKTVEIPVPRYIEVEVPEVKQIEVVTEISRNVPCPVEHITHGTYFLPALESQYEEVPLPIFVPQFVEFPVPEEYMTEQAILDTENLRQQIACVAAGAMPSLTQLDNLGQRARMCQPDMVTDPAVLRERMAQKVSNFHDGNEKVKA